MGKIPYEIYENIFYNIENIKLLILLTQVNKYFYNIINNNIFWKKICKRDYSNYNFNCSKDKYFNWKKKYISNYKKICIHCCNNTKTYNLFYNKKICKNCEYKYPIYHTISQTHAIKNYNLKKEDLLNIKCIIKKNPYNHSRPIKIYLLNDIQQLAINKFNFYSYEDTLINLNYINKILI